MFQVQLQDGQTGDVRIMRTHQFCKATIHVVESLMGTIEDATERDLPQRGCSETAQKGLIGPECGGNANTDLKCVSGPANLILRRSVMVMSINALCSVSSSCIALRYTGHASIPGKQAYSHHGSWHLI